MPVELGRRLIASGVVPPEEVEAALFLSVVRGVPFGRALVDRGAITERELEDELERLGGLSLRHVVPAPDLVARLPRSMCRRLAALPTRHDALTGVIDVAAADPLDPHVPSEFGFHFGAPIRVLRAPIAAIEEAIRQLELNEGAGERTRQRRVTPPFPHGAPQSTIPPPPTDEAPIPLVRRAEAEPETREMSTRRVPDAPSDDDVVLPLRQSKYEDPRGRPHAAVFTPTEQPSVSFPSQPPDPTRGSRWDEPLAAVGWSGKPITIRPETMAPKTAVAGPEPEILSDGRYPVSDGEVELVTAAAPPVEIAAPRLPRDLSSPMAFEPGADGGRRRTARPPLLADLHRATDQPTLTSAVMTQALAAPLMPVIAPSPAHAPRSAPTVREGKPARRGTLPPPYGSPDSDEGARMLRTVRDAPHRDELVRLVLRGQRRVARRVAVFAVRKDGYQGWACNVEFGDQDALKQIHVPGDVPSVLATASATSFYLGPIPSTPGHAALLRLMERASPDVASVAVRVGGRAAMVLLADDLDDTMLGTRFLDELARAAADALSRLLGR